MFYFTQASNHMMKENLKLYFVLPDLYFFLFIIAGERNSKKKENNVNEANLGGNMAVSVKRKKFYEKCMFSHTLFFEQW